MIRINGQGVVGGEVWYDEEPQDCGGVDVVLYRHRPVPVARGHCSPFLSLVTEISVPEDAIIGQFDETCRYQIRRAQAKDGLEVQTLRDPVSRLEEFLAFFDAFAQQKSLASADPQWLRAACRSGQLALTCASSRGEALVWHAYVLSGSTAMLQHSGSHFRERDGAYRSLVGRANRLLHWKDMLWFRQLGLERFDWGGLFEDESTPERSGISRFKQSFRGRRR